jgi:hypothetical protein
MASRFVKFVGEKGEHDATGYRDELNDSTVWIRTTISGHWRRWVVVMVG